MCRLASRAIAFSAAEPQADESFGDEGMTRLGDGRRAHRRERDHRLGDGRRNAYGDGAVSGAVGADDRFATNLIVICGWFSVQRSARLDWLCR
jgi:hypothetical protein